MRSSKLEALFCTQHAGFVQLPERGSRNVKNLLNFAPINLAIEKQSLKEKKKPGVLPGPDNNLM